MINLLGCPACFRIPVGKILLTDGFVQCRADSAGILLECGDSPGWKGAHLIWVSEVIRFCILPANNLQGGADRVTFMKSLTSDVVGVSSGALGFHHQASGGEQTTSADISTVDETPRVVL